MIKFFKELQTELKIRGYSDQTIRSYLYENKKFLGFLSTHNTNTEYQKSLLSTKGERTPQDVTKEDIRSYQAYLMADKNLKPSTVNLILSALKFFVLMFLFLFLLFYILLYRTIAKLRVGILLIELV